MKIFGSIILVIILLVFCDDFSKRGLSDSPIYNLFVIGLLSGLVYGFYKTLIKELK